MLAVSTHGLGCRFGALWALRDCTVDVPAGRVVAVVGPNGAGKTTLLNALVGLLSPTEGEARVFGEIPDDTPSFLARVGFVAQDAPLFRDFSAADHVRMGHELNATWNIAEVRDRLMAAAVPLDRRVSTLSGGQRAQLALALAAGKDPGLLILDEPLASLDPVARRDFMQSLLATAATGTTVMLSSHLISDLANVCDFLIVIVGGRLRLAGDLDDVLAQHRWVIAGAETAKRLPAGVEVVISYEQQRNARMLVRTTDPLLNPALVTKPVELEDLVLAYMETKVHQTPAPLQVRA
ncbi:MAG TPA: ABC transporter ATP-binding protein [Acidimicrobiia bacterium]